MASKSDQSLFIYRKGADILFLLVYVDDLIVTDTNLDLVSNMITKLKHEFSIRDLDDLHYFLGLEVHH